MGGHANDLVPHTKKNQIPDALYRTPSGAGGAVVQAVLLITLIYKFIPTRSMSRQAP